MKKGIRRIPQIRYNLKTIGTTFKSQAARHLIAQHTFKSPTTMHIYNDNGNILSMDELLQGSTKHIWNKSLRNE